MPARVTTRVQTQRLPWGLATRAFPAQGVERGAGITSLVRKCGADNAADSMEEVQ